MAHLSLICVALGSRRACADTLEPWPDCHKPLVAYLLIGFVNLLLGLFLELHGFELQRVGRLAYWSRPARESMLRPPPPPPMPLVLLHGVLGLLPYALMLRQLSRDHDGAVLAPLFPHCAVQLEHLCSALPPPLDATELVAAIRSMVARHTHVEKAVQAAFVAHSLGTGYLALLCRRAPELPAAVAFIDPICFLLPDGHVLRNYLYQPVTLGLSTWFHWLQRYLVADEPTQQDYFRNIFWWASPWLHHPPELHARAHHGALSPLPTGGRPHGSTRPSCMHVLTTAPSPLPTGGRPHGSTRPSCMHVLTTAPSPLPTGGRPHGSTRPSCRAMGSCCSRDATLSCLHRTCSHTSRSGKAGMD